MKSAVEHTWYALVYFPELRNDKLNCFREKYDPSYTVIREHMPLLFMIPESIGIKNLKDHIKNILGAWNTFKVHFYGLKKSWDHWLLLTVREGSEKVIQLHNDLYSGALEPYHRKDLPFDPHIGLGLFASEDYDPSDPAATEFDREKFEIARNEAKSTGFDFWCDIDKLSLVRGQNFNQPIRSVDIFDLNNF